ncbi:MAG: transcription elongation factor GreA [Chloroflexi bacterium]|nr:transcription elongation factor GreA [Chloroflexota bacterium]MDA8189873.1 transcription elongation factor GreA [Dehalococcoidales bacterium]
MAENLATLSEAATEFVASLPDESKSSQQQELSRFIRWFGGDHRVDEITGQTLETYQQQLENSGADLVRRLEPVKSFLVFAQRKEYLPVNLAKLVKFRKDVAKKEASIGGRSREEEVVQLTREGFDQLKAELKYLIEEVRPLVAHELFEARIDKDIRENAPYDAAKQHQALVEARIRELERIVGSAQIIESTTETEKVSIGSTVVLRDLAFDEEMRYTLVGSSEADPRAGKISVASPVGKALLDKMPGEVVEVAAPAGVIHYRVEAIEAQE